MGKWLGVKGLVIGGRGVGGGDSSPVIEPVIRYRTFVDDNERFSLGLSAFGTYASGEAEGASYTAVRGGMEVAANMRVTPPYKWIELHLQTGISATGISATGTYCMNNDGLGTTCGEDQKTNADAEINGIFPTVFAGAVLDLFHGFPIVFHGIKIGAYYSAGLMPTVVHAKQEDDRWWHMFGGQLTINFGAASAD